MAKKPETLFVEKIKSDLDDLQKKSGYVWFQKIQQVAVRGTPDLLLCINGKFFALEAKKDDLEKPDPLQNYNIEKIKAAGGKAFVVTPSTWPGILMIIKREAGF